MIISDQSTDQLNDLEQRLYPKPLRFTLLQMILTRGIGSSLSQDLWVLRDLQRLPQVLGTDRDQCLLATDLRLSLFLYSNDTPFYELIDHETRMIRNHSLPEMLHCP